MAKNTSSVPTKTTGDGYTAAEFEIVRGFVDEPLQSLSTFDGSLILIDGTGSYDDFLMSENLEVTFAESGHVEGNVQLVDITADGTDTLTFIKPSAFKLDIPLSLTNGDPLASGIHELTLLFKPGKIKVRLNADQNVADVIPTVTSMTVEDAEPNQLVWNFSEACTGTEQGIDFEVDNVDRSITYLSGSGTTSIIFTISGAAILSTDTLTAALTSGDLAAVAAPQNSVADFAEDTVTNNVAVSYSFADSWSLNIDAQTEGAVVQDNTLYPISGGNDRAFSWELWYTPTDLSVNRNIIVGAVASNAIVLFISTDGRLNMQLSTDGSNKLLLSASVGALVVSTEAHIIITYDGSETIGGLNIYIDNSLDNDVDNSVGSYTGLPTLTTYNLKISLDGVSTFGQGEYRNFRQENIELTSGQVTTLYNSGTPLSLAAQTTLRNACELELQFEQNLNAEIGTDASAVGSPDYVAS